VGDGAQAENFVLKKPCPSGGQSWMVSAHEKPKINGGNNYGDARANN
jgi:hypothetical protein